MEKLSNAKKVSVILLFLLILIVSGCTAKSVEGEKTIKLGLLPIEDNLPFYVAQQENMFAEAGVKVELINFPSAQEMGAAIQAGQIDGEITDLIVPHLLKKGGTDIRMAAITYGNTPKEGRFAILASPNSDIRKAEDLKNVPIGGSENTIIHYVIDNLLKDEGIKDDEIKITTIGKLPLRLEMLLKDQVEAAVFPDPLASFAELQGAHLVMDDTTRNISQTVMIFRQASIEDNPEGVKAVLKVYQDAGQAINNNPDKFREFILEKAQVPDPLKKTYQTPTYSKPQLPTEEQINKVSDWMVENKLLDVPFAYEELVDTSLLP